MSNHDREGSYPSHRDATLDRAWREASDEQPPAHLDAAIVAAARQAVADRGQQSNTVPARIASRTWLTYWQPLAAAASIAGLAFVLVQLLPREHSGAPSLQRQESVPVATQPQSSPALEATGTSQVPSIDKAIGARERDDVAVDAPAQNAVPVPPVVPASPAAKAEATASGSAELAGESRADRNKAAAPELARAAGPADVAAPAAIAKSSERNVDDAAAPLDAPAWAARIATLHAAGDVTAAEQALRDFRATEPQADGYLPESLRSWARTVQ